MPNPIAIKKRLALVRGQLDGLIRMLEAEKDCHAIITQFKAAQAGLAKAGALFVQEHMLHCLAQKKTKTSATDLERLIHEAFRA